MHFELAASTVGGQGGLLLLLLQSSQLSRGSLETGTGISSGSVSWMVCMVMSIILMSWQTVGVRTVFFDSIAGKGTLLMLL